MLAYRAERPLYRRDARIYWPKPGALDGNWQKPPLEKAN